MLARELSSPGLSDALGRRVVSDAGAPGKPDATIVDPPRETRAQLARLGAPPSPSFTIAPAPPRRDGQPARTAEVRTVVECAARR